MPSTSSWVTRRRRTRQEAFARTIRAEHREQNATAPGYAKRLTNLKKLRRKIRGLLAAEAARRAGGAVAAA